MTASQLTLLGWSNLFTIAVISRVECMCISGLVGEVGVGGGGGWAAGGGYTFQDCLE